MAHNVSVPITIDELESLLRAIDADRSTGRRTRQEAEEEIVRLTGGRR